MNELAKMELSSMMVVLFSFFLSFLRKQYRFLLSKQARDLSITEDTDCGYFLIFPKIIMPSCSSLWGLARK